MLDGERNFWVEIVNSSNGTKEIILRERKIRLALGIYYGRRGIDEDMETYKKLGLLIPLDEKPVGKNGRWYVADISKIEDYLRQSSRQSLSSSPSL